MDQGTPAERRAPRRGSLLRETVIILLSALALSWLIKTFLVQAFFIPSASMEDTLVEGDRVMVSRLVPDVFDVHRGDVIVFKDPGNWLPPYVAPDRGPVGNAVTSAMTFVGLLPQDTGEHLIKRVIGLPGDRVVCCDAQGRVSVNGQPIDETYIKPGSVPSQDPFDAVVPEGMLFVMGDNRQHSADSRYNTGKPGGGFVPINNVVGTAFVKVWPLSDFTFMRNPGDVFAQVPEP
ncbi:signal peptidase I [Oerskovia turbata]